ncbi:MAG: LTA synthase family protein [Deltaproteobacteria bacterium]|nr:LTA synthase family protein [Deltaproteobacteria bacterium]
MPSLEASDRSGALAFPARLLAVLFLYSIHRVLFLFHNLDVFRAAPWREIAHAFGFGVRFDLVAVFMISVPLIALAYFPWPRKIPGNVAHWFDRFFLLLHTPFIFLNCADLEYFGFTGRRTTMDIFRIHGDILDQAGQLLIHYWQVPLWTLLSVAFLWWVCHAIPLPRRRPASIVHRWIVFAVASLTAVLMIRNSFQSKPLMVPHAFAYSTPPVGNLALNTPVGFLQSYVVLEGKSLPRTTYFRSVREYWPLLSIGERAPRPRELQNIVVIIVESLSSSFVGAENPDSDLTPFIDQLARSGLHFRNFYAAGRRTVYALPALFAGVPGLMDEAVFNSAYRGDSFFGLGHTLREYGYRTAFFHGARNGSMGLDYASKMVGFEEYFGKDEFESWRGAREKDYDGDWGIFDEPFLGFVVDRLDGFREPFAAAILTLTTHQPYAIPQKYEGEFPAGRDPMDRCVRYLDRSLSGFFESARKKPWFRNTLFIITADHTHTPRGGGPPDMLEEHDIPLILYHPSRELPAADTGKVGYQGDLAPTVLDYLGIDPRKRTVFGRSLFRNSPGFAMFRSSGVYALVRNDFVVTFSDTSGPRLFRYPSVPGRRWEEVNDPVLREERAKILKALVQHHNNGLLDNRLFEE